LFLGSVISFFAGNPVLGGLLGLGFGIETLTSYFNAKSSRYKVHTSVLGTFRDKLKLTRRFFDPFDYKEVHELYLKKKDYEDFFTDDDLE